MIRLFEDVHTWGRWNAEKKFNFNGFLFTGPDGTVVVDPPPFDEDDKAYWDAMGLKADLVIITNRNHIRDSRWFKAPVAMHENEVSQVDIEVQQALKGDESLPNGLRLVELPGKSPGEIGLYQPQRRLLMLGDALIAPGGALKLIPEAKLDDPVRLRLSLQELRAIDFDVLLLADGEPLLRDAKARVLAFLDR